MKNTGRVSVDKTNPRDEEGDSGVFKPQKERKLNRVALLIADPSPTNSTNIHWNNLFGPIR